MSHLFDIQSKDTFRLSGVTLPPGNKCHKLNCENDACTAVWKKNVQVNLCGWHLKVEIEAV